MVIHKTAKKVAFCCNNCPKGFAKKNGFEFAAEPADPGNCPLSGNPAKKDQKIVVNGKPVYFCCGNCPKAYISKNFKKGAGSEKKEKKTKKKEL